MSENEHSKDLGERVRERFGETLTKVETVHGETTIELAPDDLLEVCTALRDEPDFRFACIIDVSGVDYLTYGKAEWDTSDVKNEGYARGVEGQASGRFAWEERARGPAVSSMSKRFASVIHLLSMEHNERIRIRVFCADSTYPIVPSITSLWVGANWFERESFDLYGIVYDGHPDLRRILTDYGFVGHPFRKDFPLIGNVEVRYDPVAGRVIYEPVNSVVPRVTVPRVIRDDSALLQGKAEAADHWQEN
jgi:NADH-quinone oxidoreductase subunit C